MSRSLWTDLWSYTCVSGAPTHSGEAALWWICGFTNCWFLDPGKGVWWGNFWKL